MRLSKFIDLNGSSIQNEDYTPANGEIIFLESLSTTGPANTFAKGKVVWDPAGANDTIDGWAGDKVVTYPDNSPEFTFVGDGSKKLRLVLENTSVATPYRIGASLSFKSTQT